MAEDGEDAISELPSMGEQLSTWTVSSSTRTQRGSLPKDIRPYRIGTSLARMGRTRVRGGLLSQGESGAEGLSGVRSGVGSNSSAASRRQELVFVVGVRQRRGGHPTLYESVQQELQGVGLEPMHSENPLAENQQNVIGIVNPLRSAPTVTVVSLPHSLTIQAFQFSGEYAVEVSSSAANMQSRSPVQR